jgi:transposase
MESTSDYWRPFYYVLEADLEVLLLNARDVKNVPGRKQMSSTPPGWPTWAPTGCSGHRSCRRNRSGKLRDLTRARTHITQGRTREIQRLEKLLESAGIKLSSVATDITGVSGRSMLQALIDSNGTADPAVMADLVKARMRSKIPMLTEALNGWFTAHHAFMTRLFLDRRTNSPCAGTHRRTATTAELRDRQ